MRFNSTKEDCMDNTFDELIQKAKSTFPTKQTIDVRIRKDACNPFGNIMFAKMILDSKKCNHTDYTFYIHKKYLTIRSSQFKAFPSIKIELHDQLWIEMYYIFEIRK